MAKIIGIDLGTTNSCIAVVEAVAPRVLPNREGSRTTASIVAFTEDGDRLVGQIAKRQAITNPQNTVFAVKRLIGRKYEDPNVQRARSVLPYTLAEAANGDVNIQIRDRQYSPEEISAFILREIKGFAEEALGEAVNEAIITVPAYFNDSQRQATKDAGRIAGLDVLRIINEPTAAALAYGVDQRHGSKTIAVYDLGGGTFDISILELSEGIFEVRSTAGDTYLGGEDFDQRIMDWLIAEFKRETGVDLRTDRMALQRLKEAAERAKCELSTATEAPLNLPFISADESGPRHLVRSLTREEFETLVGDLVERTEAPVPRRPGAGGAARRPGRRGAAGRRPDAHAAGPAAGGADLRQAGQPRDQSRRGGGGRRRHPGRHPARRRQGHRAPRRDAAVARRRDPRRPVHQAHRAQLHDPDQEHASLHHRGRQPGHGRGARAAGRARDRRREPVARPLRAGRHPAAPRGVPQIEVTFAIDSNGIVNVSARDLATNQSQGMQINPAGGLSKDEIERLVREADEHAGTDLERREVRRLKNRLEGLIYTTERVFDQFRHLFADEDAKKTHEKILRARVALGADSRADIEAAMFDLNGVAQQLGEMMMAKQQDEEQAAPSGAGTGA